jgi:hypothetical protein
MASLTGVAAAAISCRRPEQVSQYLEKFPTIWASEAGAGIPSWPGFPFAAIAPLRDITESSFAVIVI